MRNVPLTVKVTSSVSPQFTVIGNHIQFQNEKYNLGNISFDSMSHSTLARLFLASCTIVLVGDSLKTAAETLSNILEYGCSIEQASISAAEVCKNRSYIDVLSSDQTRKYLKSMPLSRVVKKTKLTKAVAQQTCSPLSAHRVASNDLPRLRSVSVVSIYHGSNVLTILDISGAERLNGFCRLNDGLNPDSQQKGCLSSFIFELVPMNNTKYYLHLDQGGEETIITSLLNIFGHLCSNNSSSSSTSLSSSSPSSGVVPNYARPTKSSIAPKKINLIYLISKPKVQNTRKSIYSSPHVIGQVENIYKLSQFKKLASNLESQYYQKLSTFKSDFAELKSTSGSLQSAIALIKAELSVAQKAAEDQILKHKHEIDDLKQKLVDAQKKSLLDLALKDEHSNKQISRLSAQLKDVEQALSEAKTKSEQNSKLESEFELMMKEKESIQSKCNTLSQNEKALQAEVQNLTTQNEIDSSEKNRNLNRLEEENKRLSTKVLEITANELLQKEFVQGLEREISELKAKNAEKSQEISLLMSFKNKASELEISTINLKKELQDAKAQIQTSQSRVNDQVQVVNSNEDVTKIFGYSDVDFGNISTSFSPISGYEHLSQIEFPSILKKPPSGVASSPNNILRQSNVRFNAPPPIGKLASSPVRKELRSWDDIENQR